MPLGPRFDEALAYASELHRTQVRKGTEIPYVAHLLSVAAMVIEHGGKEDEAIAALLHDAIEDQGGEATRVVIAQKFGEAVAEIVVGCTDSFTDPKPPWEERKKAYLAALPTKPRAVRLVSTCDKLHNARAILNDYRNEGPYVWKRFTGGRDGTLWYYRELVKAFRAAKPRVGPIDDLARTVNELVKLAYV